MTTTMQMEASRGFARDLYADCRGAVMMMGLFMSTFLIGSLWYMIGIGDALITHDRLQEAADSVAFTSAAVHARGMNFIAAINLVMLALVGLYLIMGIINDILFAIKTALEICSATVAGCLVCCEPLAIAEPAYHIANKIWTGYAKIMKPALRVMGYTQYAAAVIYPLAGEAAGLYVGSKYKQTGLSVSPSMIPGNALTGGLTKNANGSTYQAPINTGVPKPPDAGKVPNLRGADSKIALPVKFAKMNKLCELAMKNAIDGIMSLVKKIPGIGAIISGVWNVIGSFVEDAIASAGMARYCNEEGLGGGFDPGFDEFWGLNGPKVMWEQASNGNDWMQVWSMVLPQTQADNSEKRVAMAQGPKNFGVGMQEPVVPMYTAQAEFFYDCNEAWEKCNKYENAIFSMRWRVRLRRVRSPDFLKMLVDWGSSSILNGGVTGWLKAKVKDSAIFDSAKKSVEGLAGKWGADKLFGWITKSKNGDGGMDKLFDAIKGPWKDAAYVGAFGKAADLGGNPVIH